MRQICLNIISSYIYLPAFPSSLIRGSSISQTDISVFYWLYWIKQLPQSLISIKCWLGENVFYYWPEGRATKSNIRVKYLPHKWKVLFAFTDWFSSEVSSKYHSPLRVSFPTIFGYDCYDCLILVDLLRQVPQSTCNIKKRIIKPHFICHNPPLNDPKLPQKLQGQLNFLTVMLN